MAIAAEERNKSGIFWMNDTSDDDQPMVFVPGVSRKLGLSRGPGITGEGKGRVQTVHRKGNPRGPSQQSSRSVPSSEGKSSTRTTSSTRPTPAEARSSAPTHKPPENPCSSPQAGHGNTKPSLKDLCPEDKRRIANLIQELARVSEEKEESVQKLRDEQETFERKILELEQQNQFIVHERESLKQQYRECQELLSLYQQYLSQQQDKLNQSIAQLNQARSHTKASRSERSSHRSRSAKPGTLDGSYLDLPSPRDTPRHGATAPVDRARSLLANHGRAPATPTPAPLSSAGSSSVSDSKTRSSRSAARPRRDHHTHPHAQGRETGAEEGEQRGGQAASAAASAAAAAPPPGWEDWEERRRRLVEQKRQLEQERERLQHRLALQEERLSQQLHETHLLNDGLQHTDAAGLEKPLPNGSLLVQPPLVNGCGGHSDERGNMSRLGGPANVPNIEVSRCEDPSSAPLKHLSLQEPSPLTKKDMATSPAAPSMPSAAPVMPPCLPCTPHHPRRASPNSSLMELLEIFSPVSLAECPGPHQRAPTSALRPPRHGLLSPASRSCLPPQDPEESQILEDIFFIC
ncbi:protein hinderin [Sardina pilchardus]|uniref:protein hinderin n=1 Tax=Sardina pilchardus TaxID=27697 RepID=UPI002E0D2A35